MSSAAVLQLNFVIYTSTSADETNTCDEIYCGVRAFFNIAPELWGTLGRGGGFTEEEDGEDSHTRKGRSRI